MFLTGTRSFLLNHHSRSFLSNLILQEARATRLINLIDPDFEKAFDSVNHRLLLGKLKSFGVDGNVLSWVKSYLSSRSNPVQIDDILSDDASCLSGPVIVPLLFLFCLNDLPVTLGESDFLFADNVKMVFPRPQSSRLLLCLPLAWA